MSTSNAQQLTEAEAEAVLLALAPRLEWINRKDGSMTHPLPERGFYMVWLDSPESHFCSRRVLNQKESVDGPNYETMTTAKAACERHYATGKWTE